VISVLALSSVEKELTSIVRCCKSIAAKYSDDEWDFHVLDGSCSENDIFHNTAYIDIAFIDVTADIGVRAAEVIRKHSDSSMIVIISDEKISPLYYVKLSVKASALLLRPFNDIDIKKIIDEILKEYKNRLPAFLENDFFVIKNNEGKCFIPYNSILYFESRRKKIIVFTEGKEISFYGTMNDLEKNLPPVFIRCHRSFIISCSKISSVKLSGYTISLLNGITIPVSRKYQDIVRKKFL